jgi:hypothetical protein
MMKLVALLLLPIFSWAQAPPACNCAQNLAHARQLLETNYSGYRDKVTVATRPRLDSLLTALQPQVAVANARTCGQLLQQYLRFFRDGHVQLTGGATAPAGSPDSIRARYASAERLPWTRASFRAYLDDEKRPKKPLEGIWQAADGGGYVVGIVASGAASYKGFVLHADSTYWVPGQVKFSFADPAAKPATATYYMRDHSTSVRPVQVVGDGQLTIMGPWYRTYPRPVPVPPPIPSLSFQMLDDTTALYRIASFEGSLGPKIDSLTNANARQLAHTRLLILDVRGNGGGSDGSYSSLVPYLYTNPVKETSAAIYSTTENNSAFAGPFPPGTSASQLKYYTDLKQRLDAHLGQFVSMNLHSKSQTHTKRLKQAQVKPSVRRVAVLQNRYCASTTEQFLLLAQQSRKTTTFGENSEGVLDYSNLHFAPLPCYGLRLGWAISRSYRIDQGKGIDNVGLRPLVQLDPAAPDMVEQVRTWYRTH